LIIVAHVCNPKYLGGRDQENHGLMSAPTKKVSKTPNSTNTPGDMVHVYILAMWEA
jgi:hypothetical protein